MQLFTENLKYWHIEIIARMKLTLEHIYVVEQWMNGNKIENKTTTKLRSIYWIKDNEITTLAQDTYYAIINTEEPVAKSKAKVKAVTIPTKYDDAWSDMWNMWPSMRSFEWKGRKFVCNKPFKSNEQKLKLKYIATIENGDITAEQLNKAAKTALSWCMENSSRKGKNEMEYMNGMEVFLNQRLWKNWLNVEMPIVEDREKQVEMIGI